MGTARPGQLLFRCGVAHAQKAFPNTPPAHIYRLFRASAATSAENNSSMMRSNGIGHAQSRGGNIVGNGWWRVPKAGSRNCRSRTADGEQVIHAESGITKLSHTEQLRSGVTVGAARSTAFWRIQIDQHAGKFHALMCQHHLRFRRSCQHMKRST